MNTKSLFTRLLSFKYRSLSILALGGCLLPNAVHAGTCDATIADLVSWLKQNPAHDVIATVAANRPPSWILQDGTPPAGLSEVTYSTVGLKPSTGYFPGGLTALSTQPLLYDDRLWYSPGTIFPGHPFSPTNTDAFGLLITSTGTVYVYPANGSQSFAATCTPSSVMYGQPATPNFNLALPFYTITFAKLVSGPPQ